MLPDAIVEIGQRLGLCDDEQRLLALAIAPSYRTSIARLYGALQGRDVSSGLTEAVLARLAQHHATRQRWGQRVRSRLDLPLLLLVVMALVAPLPALIGQEIDAAGYLRRALLPLVSLAVLVLLLIRVARRAQGQDLPRALERLLLWIPGVGKMVRLRAQRDLLLNLALLLAEPGASAWRTHLDIGAGRGGLIQRVRSKLQVTSSACDYTAALMELPGQSVDVANLNHEPLPYDDASFDVVTATEVIGTSRTSAASCARSTACCGRAACACSARPTSST